MGAVAYLAGEEGRQTDVQPRELVWAVHRGRVHVAGQLVEVIVKAEGHAEGATRVGGNARKVLPWPPSRPEPATPPCSQGNECVPPRGWKYTEAGPHKRRGAGREECERATSFTRDFTQLLSWKALKRGLAGGRRGAVQPLPRCGSGTPPPRWERGRRAGPVSRAVMEGDTGRQERSDV